VREANLHGRKQLYEERGLIRYFIIIFPWYENMIHLNFTLFFVVLQGLFIYIYLYIMTYLAIY